MRLHVPPAYWLEAIASCFWAETGLACRNESLHCRPFGRPHAFRWHLLESCCRPHTVCRMTFPFFKCDQWSRPRRRYVVYHNAVVRKSLISETISACMWSAQASILCDRKSTHHIKLACLTPIITRSHWRSRWLTSFMSKASPCRPWRRVSVERSIACLPALALQLTRLLAQMLWALPWIWHYVQPRQALCVAYGQQGRILCIQTCGHRSKAKWEAFWVRKIS